MLCILIVTGVLFPVLGLIGSADASTLGALRVPAGTIALAITISYLIALALLALTFASRWGAVGWICSVGAVVATLVGSIWPLIATALASVSQAQEALPFMQRLIGQVIGQH